MFTFVTPWLALTESGAGIARMTETVSSLTAEGVAVVVDARMWGQDALLTLWPLTLAKGFLLVLRDTGFWVVGNNRPDDFAHQFRQLGRDGLHSAAVGQLNVGRL
jgi:hypothetical protein